jgi:hypothetical protein
MPAHSRHQAKPSTEKSRAAAVDETLNVHSRTGRSLPHELDETPDTGLPQEGTRDVVKQGARDVRRGLRDTERRGVPSDVPGPSDDPQRTRGADVLVHGKR